jgi:salicylate hydroxylase
VRPPRVTVIGAGIGGLVFAVAAHQAGIPVTVYEQAERIGPIGAGLQIGPNASKLLYRLGLGAKLANVAVRPRAMEVRHWRDGSVQSRMPLPDWMARVLGGPYLLVHRAALHAALAGALPPETIRIGKRCVRVEESDHAVHIEFADGTHAIAEVLIGADGLHSTVRAGLVDVAPRFAGTCAYRGLVPHSALKLMMTTPAVRLWAGPDRHFVCYPVAGGELLNFVAVVPGTMDTPESWSRGGDLAAALAGFAGWDAPVTEAIGAASQLLCTALYDRDPLSRWSTARTTLLGDAAHPVLPHQGQGAGQAIEDGLLLAALLRESPRLGVAEALLRYERLRIPRTTRVLEASRANAERYRIDESAGGVDRWRRRIAFVRQMVWLLRYDTTKVAEAAVRP